MIIYSLIPKMTEKKPKIERKKERKKPWVSSLKNSFQPLIAEGLRCCSESSQSSAECNFPLDSLEIKKLAHEINHERRPLPPLSPVAHRVQGEAGKIRSTQLRVGNAGRIKLLHASIEPLVYLSSRSGMVEGDAVWHRNDKEPFLSQQLQQVAVQIHRQPQIASSDQPIQSKQVKTKKQQIVREIGTETCK